MKMLLLDNGPNATAPFAHALQPAHGNHAQAAQTSFRHTQCVLVDHRDLTQPKLMVRELQPACLAHVREVRRCTPKPVGP